MIRLFTFFVFVSAISVCYLAKLSWLEYLLSLFPLLPFIYLVRLYARRKLQLQFAKKTFHFIEEEIHRLTGEFKKIKTREIWEYPVPVRNHPLSIDLDLCTKQGFLGVFDITITESGFHNYLYRFLQEPNGLVGEPKPNLGLVEQILKQRNYPFQLMRKFLVLDGEPNEKFALPQVNQSSSFWEKRNWLRWIFPIWGVFSPMYMSVGLLFDLPLIPFLFLINGLLFLNYRKESLLYWKEIKALSTASVRFQKTFLFLSKNRKTTKSMLTKISKLGDSAELLVSPLPHLVLNLIFLWDLWKIQSLIKWKLKFSEDWNRMQNQIIGMDSILPFVNFGYIHPEANFPNISNQKSLKADSLVHPMLPETNRVFNPLPEMKPGDLMIVTGSNMSGKTTYLRSIAMSLLLAGSGAPVLGKKFEQFDFQIHTLIRSQDSMEDGVSFFYSEVRRLSSIIQNANGSKKIPILFLDEILKGTNSKERFIATREILSVLREKNCIVFLTTHDLKLADIPWAKRFHFTELELDGKMDFDYKIRSGVSTSTNALKILKKEGIPIRSEAE
ncbi:MutS domain V protein [Leptospira yanagawae serovar Saopaulo str. Sao Paulo = ATCC 700523]|uniref:MutS domain V protein n=1 Tax=Leptospira yanagawae serovar Saopaulo str. Sao Paulo = ATCC 700523 TaxID=1249483 RepID=A0A5E8HDU0_9LEPT|nr:MutS domain V protein [Leptospira yanagawae serovar Saopaulo str. Sao Paulo = ATCC 700523]